jgi:hypothetical protein
MIRNQSGQTVGAQMTNATTGADFTGTVTVYVTGDGGTQAIGSVGSGVCTHEGNGYHTYAPSAAETNYALAAFTFIGSGAITVTKEYPTLTAGQSAALSTGVTGVGPTFSDLYDNALHVELGSNDTAVLFTTVRRKHAINEGYRQFAALTECFVRQETINCTQAVQEFNLNSTTVIADGDYIRPATQGPVFQISDSNGLRQTLSGDLFPQVSVPYLDYGSQDWRSTGVGYPTGWYLRSDGGQRFLGVDRPVGLSTSSTETARILWPYIAKPSSMTQDNEVPFAADGLSRSDLYEYRQAFVHYAAHDLEKLRKDKDASDYQLKKFQGYVQRYLDVQRPKGNRVVRAAVSYFSRSRRSSEGGSPLAPWWR